MNKLLSISYCIFVFCFFSAQYPNIGESSMIKFKIVFSQPQVNFITKSFTFFGKDCKLQIKHKIDGIYFTDCYRLTFVLISIHSQIMSLVCRLAL